MLLGAGAPAPFLPEAILLAFLQGWEGTLATRPRTYPRASWPGPFSVTSHLNFIEKGVQLRLVGRPKQSCLHADLQGAGIRGGSRHGCGAD